MRPTRSTRPARVHEGSGLRLWDEVLAAGRVHGFRNAQATVLAPTGTISFLMDCDTTGIEPDIALVKYKQLAGGGMLKIVNNTVPAALESSATINRRSTASSITSTRTTRSKGPGREGRAPAVFDCGFEPRKRQRARSPGMLTFRMMAAAQPVPSGAISKTVNMPREARRKTSPKPIPKVGGSASRPSPSIATARRKANRSIRAAKKARPPTRRRRRGPRRRRLPDTRNSITHKFSVGGHEGYLTVGLYEDGRPGECSSPWPKKAPPSAG